MNRVLAKSILSDKNNMNPYRGCTHGCIYCDSRSMCYGMTYTFEDIQVKENAPLLLEKALARKKENFVITTGAMCDPYIPLEREERITQQCLEVIEKYGFGVALLTKSDLVLRDMELLQRIHHKAKCVVQMTLTTYDESLCSILEPHVSTTYKRFQALQELKKAGIPTVVWMTPLLPWINDTAENVEGILEYCGEADVKGLVTFGVGMTLRSGNREYFYKQLDTHFPQLKQQYMQTFGTAYGIHSPNSRQLGAKIRSYCKKREILYKTADVFSYIQHLEPQATQLSLW